MKADLIIKNAKNFLVFDQDLLNAEQGGISYTMPSEVYFGGKKM